MLRGAEKQMADSRSIVSSSSSNGSMTDAKEPCSTSTTSSYCESHPLVSLLERLRALSASEMGRKRKNPAPQHGRRSAQHGESARICNVFSLFFCVFRFFGEEFPENNRALTGE